MIFYAFSYTDGTNTTTGEGCDIHIAGKLFAFSSKELRDKYVDAGYSYRVPYTWGDFRKKVDGFDLPMGWTRCEAEAHDPNDTACLVPCNGEDVICDEHLVTQENILSCQTLEELHELLVSDIQGSNNPYIDYTAFPTFASTNSEVPELAKTDGGIFSWSDNKFLVTCDFAGWKLVNR